MNRIIVACLVAFAIVLIELMAGGTRYVFCIPSYTLLGCASLIAIFRRPDRTSKVAADAVIVTLIVFAYILWRAALSPLEYYWWADFLSGLGCLCVYLLTAFHLTGLRERRIIITALLLLAVLEILFGIRQFAGGDEWMPFGFMSTSPAEMPRHLECEQCSAFLSTFGRQRAARDSRRERLLLEWPRERAASRRRWFFRLLAESQL